MQELEAQIEMLHKQIPDMCPLECWSAGMDA